MMDLKVLSRNYHTRQTNYVMIYEITSICILLLNYMGKYLTELEC